MSCLDELYEQYPVRNTAEQKKNFRNWAAAQAEKSGWTVREEENEEHINLVIGDPERAKLMFTAHYDTPRRSFLPNVLLPANKTLKTLYTFGVLLPMLAVAVGAALLAGQAAGGFGTMTGRMTAMVTYMILYFALFFLLLRGPANRENKNDNSSGAAAVLDLAARLAGNGSAALILFDDEEKGKKGSKAWTTAHPTLKSGLLDVNLDCVGNGEHVIVSVPPEAEHDPAWPALKAALEELDAVILPAGSTAMNSDQKNFEKGVGICVCLKKKKLYYTPRIHTSRDTIASGETVDCLVGALASFAGGAPAQKA